jgi:hypothetical protein
MYRSSDVGALSHFQILFHENPLSPAAIVFICDDSDLGVSLLICITENNCMDRTGTIGVYATAALALAALLP